MYGWRNIDTGELIEIEERYLKKCPNCGKSFDDLHSNRYKDLYVSNGNYDDISICINMVYCSSCGELHIRTDY